MLEYRIANFRQHGIKLIAGSIVVNALQQGTKPFPKPARIVNPTQVRSKLKVLCFQVYTYLAGPHRPEFFNPLHKRSIGVFATLLLEDCRQNAEKIVIPLPFARGHGRIVVFQKPPDLAQGDQIGYLNFVERIDGNAGAFVEFVIGARTVSFSLTFGASQIGFPSARS